MLDFIEFISDIVSAIIKMAMIIAKLADHPTPKDILKAVGVILLFLSLVAIIIFCIIFCIGQSKSMQ